MSRAETVKSALTSRVTAGALAFALTLVGGFEGVRLAAYRDPVGIPTICFGSTQGVQMGQRKSMQECNALLASELAHYAAAVERCVNVPMTEARWAAMISFTYNVGEGAFARSTLLRKLNAGDTRGACDELLRWDKAMGIRLPGLTARRQEERALCLQGL